MKASSAPLLFYSVADEYGEFSNFSLHPIFLDGSNWPTVEHYFQAQKFVDEAYRQKIRKSHSPMAAATLGRDRRMKLRKDWESAKVSVMKKAVHAKFSQHVDLTDLLLGTGDRKIVEDAEADSFWGCGADGKGRNMLGTILIEVREELARTARR